MKQIKLNPLFTVILLLSPFIIYWLTLLLPTFDDWGYFTTPDYDFGDIEVIYYKNEVTERMKK